jgi:hypothetical protein
MGVYSGRAHLGLSNEPQHDAQSRECKNLFEVKFGKQNRVRNIEKWKSHPNMEHFRLETDQNDQQDEHYTSEITWTA